MEILWAPWRMKYILGPKPDSCIFCIEKNTPDEHYDEEHGILYRGKRVFVVMNKFPYNNGHLLVVPYRHTADFSSLDLEESAECMHVMQRCVAILVKSLHPDGVNMGLNLGEAAGAGVRQHLHFHLVPRWNGDSSFMPVCGDVRIMPQLLSEAYHVLKPHFDALLKSEKA